MPFIRSTVAKRFICIRRALTALGFGLMLAGCETRSDLRLTAIFAQQENQLHPEVPADATKAPIAYGGDNANIENTQAQTQPEHEYFRFYYGGWDEEVLRLTVYRCGTIERWRDRGQTIYEHGSSQLSQEQADRLFEMANRVRVTDVLPNDPKVHYDEPLYGFYLNTTGERMGCGEHLAPKTLIELHNELKPIVTSIPLLKNDRHFLVVNPVTGVWLANVQSSTQLNRLKKYSISDFTPDERSAIVACKAKPDEFVHISKELYDSLMRYETRRQFFVTLDDGSIIQVGLCFPPDR